MSCDVGTQTVNTLREKGLLPGGGAVPRRYDPSHGAAARLVLSGVPVFPADVQAELRSLILV